MGAVRSSPATGVLFNDDKFPLLMFMFVASLRWWHMKTQACFSNGLSPHIHISPEPVLANDRGPP